MEAVNKNVMLARTSPRIKRSAANTVGDRVVAEKCTTDSKQQINSRQKISIGQWNVRGLNALGKLSILSSELERMGIGICGLSETKWSNNGHFTTMDGHTVLFSGREDREHHGVAIWIHRSFASCLLSYNTVSSRIISATFAAKPRNVTVIQCYAPTADKTDEETEEFYTQLDSAMAEIREKNILVITGDLMLKLEKMRQKVMSLESMDMV